MITLIGYAVVIACVVGCAYAILTKLKTTDSPLNSLSENELVKKFNGLATMIGSSSKRNIDSIAEELKQVLKEYKCRKIEQFIESQQLLAKNRNHLNEEIDKLTLQIKKLNNDATALASNNTMTDDDLEAGALIMAQIEETEKLKETLRKTYDENEKRFETVEKQIKNFNIKYTLKETSITNMIVLAKTSKSISNVDLKLNDLISEFKDKVQDNEIEYNVKSQINGTNDDEANPIEFDLNKDKYIDQFKKFVKNN